MRLTIKNYTGLTLISFGIIFQLSFNLWLKNEAVAAFNDQPSLLFKTIIDLFYPRFWILKKEYPLSIFLDYGYQVVLRTSFFLIVIGTCILSKKSTLWIKQKAITFLNVKANKGYIDIISTLYYTLFLGIVIHWYWDLKALQYLSSYYEPILLLKALPNQLPSENTLSVIYFLMVISAILSIKGRQRFIASIICILLFVYLHGVFCSLQKMDHAYVTYMYAGMLLPIQFFIIKKEKKIVDAWPIHLIQLIICLVYLQAGLEKLTISGIDWADIENFKVNIRNHPTVLGNWLATKDILCWFFTILTVLIQLTFLIIIPFPKLKWVYLAAGISFHWGIVILLDIGSFYNPWILVYIFFLIPFVKKRI